MQPMDLAWRLLKTGNLYLPGQAPEKSPFGHNWKRWERAELPRDYQPHYDDSNTGHSKEIYAPIEQEAMMHALKETGDIPEGQAPSTTMMTFLGRESEHPEQITGLVPPNKQITQRYPPYTTPTAIPHITKPMLPDLSPVDTQQNA
jgi:hypothetical protein